ncbi:MAG: ATP-binding protein [Myxococcota bacterium]
MTDLPPDMHRPPRSRSQAIRQVEHQLTEMRRKRPVRVSLRWQILVVLLAVLLTTIGLIGVVAVGLMRHSMEVEYLKSSQALGRMVADQAEALLEADATTGVVGLEALVQRTSVYPEVEQVVVVGPAHQVLAASDDSGSQERPRALFDAVLQTGLVRHQVLTLPSQERRLWLVTPIEGGGALGLQMSLGRVDLHVSVTQNLLIFYLVADALLMFVVGYLTLTRVIVHPIRAIVSAVRQVAGGAYEERLELTSSNELGVLAAEFNAMVDQLHQHRAQLERKVDELEGAYDDLSIAQQSLVRSEKLVTVGQLAAGVAHEVGNPLAAALGYTELLREGGLDPEDQTDLLRRTEEAIRRIDRTIRELLDYSRAERVELEPSPLRQVVMSSIHLVEAQPRFRNVELSVHLPDRLPLVLLNEGKMQQVLVNLLLNAADAMDNRGRITLSAGRDGAYVELVVRDTGPGISPEALPLLFEPFFTTKDPGRGTGLGLAICQSIMESFGGTIVVSSEPGRGAAFLLRLPIATDPAQT